ncbi:TPA: LysR family transcriptional regulator [Listeria monocytogenes]|nr:LysR family transcriptional regulator [Listeria monocytogenes]
MDIKYLETFITIVETGSFQKAAEQLNFAPSTITFHIQNLEQELSLKLFEKLGRKMQLTTAGKNLLPYVENVLITFENIRDLKNIEEKELKGDIYIGVAETILCYKLASIIKKFKKIAPKARVFIRSMNCYDIRDSLLEGSLDIGLFYQDIEGFGSQLIAHSIGKYPLVLVASPNTQKLYPDFITPDQQLSVPFIINEPNSIFREKFEEYVKRKSILVDYTVELWSIPTIKTLVVNDYGVTFLPKFTVEEELMKQTLVELPTEISYTELSAICAYHKNKNLSSVMDLFIELCNESFE